MTGKPGNQRIPMFTSTFFSAQMNTQARTTMKTLAQASMEVRVMTAAL